jgi:nicotinamide mononucleotide transporter
LDVITTVLSLLAMWYLSVKKIAGWVIWFVVDILMIIMFINAKLYPSVVLYIILTLLTINGFLEWKKNIKMV